MIKGYPADAVNDNWDELTEDDKTVSFHTPPPFKACPECCGKGTVSSTSASYEGYAKDCECPTCHGTRRISIWYTVERWEELTERKVPEDMPVWWYNDSTTEWCLSKYRKTLFLDLDDATEIVIATEAGVPDWRPE